MKPVEIEIWKQELRKEIEELFRKYGLEPSAPNFMETLVAALSDPAVDSDVHWQPPPTKLLVD